MKFSGPTFDEMLHPETITPKIRTEAVKALDSDPLNPVNLYNISWRNRQNSIRHMVLPSELTGVDANIVVLYSSDFPTGSHKVGAAYSLVVEMMMTGKIDPSLHVLVWPSTGNYGIGGTWVGSQLGFENLVVMPDGMSQERFQKIEEYGGKILKIPGTESNVREIYEKVRELEKDPKIRVMNQFREMANYRFHYYVTGNTIVELAEELSAKGIGNGKITAFCSAMGSAGTIAAGDLLKQKWADTKIVGLEPIQCSTLYNNGYGSHEIQGIGDKHVTWIHHVTNMDAIMCIEDTDCLKALQLVTDSVGRRVLENNLGINKNSVDFMSTIFGISGICNVLGAIKTAKYYQLQRSDTVITICTDTIDRYGSVMQTMTDRFGEIDEETAINRTNIFHGQGTEWIKNGTVEQKCQWHNLKYYTWVEQQGLTVKELDHQLNEDWWLQEQARIQDIDELIIKIRRS